MSDLKINKLYPIVILMLLHLGSCSGNEPINSQSPQHMIKKGIDTTRFDKNYIETNFPLTTIEDINMQKITFNGESNYHIPFSVLSDVFLIPVNEVQYSKSYFENIYTTYYGYKLSEHLWILAYHIHYDQHFLDIVWNIYDNKHQKITSK